MPLDNVKVVTYNLLSPELCTPTGFPQTNPAHLDNENRKNLIFEKLKDEITSHSSILCLQEVSRSSMMSELRLFLESQNYGMVEAYYGTKWNGYMGVVVAYPRKWYTLEDLAVQNIADTMYQPRVTKSVMRRVWDFVVFWSLWFGSLLSKRVQSFKGDYYFDDFAQAKRRFNCLAMAQLKDKNSEELFWVGTYHMPCAFKHPGVMKLHVSHLLKFIDELCEEPFILAGDFNSMPGSVVYQLLSSKLKSAYAAVDGLEPECTTRCFTQHGGGEFKGTLDYIFVSREWSVGGVDELKPPELCPNDQEPSDHLKLGAYLYIEDIEVLEDPNYT